MYSVSYFFNSSKSAKCSKNRVIILSDIEADPDDTQSFVRLLLNSNEIDIKGMRGYHILLETIEYSASVDS